MCQQLHAKWGCQTAGDVQKLPIEDLIGSFGARFGNYLYKAVRGIYMEKGIIV
jgi:nucleotidyltransferase/DNA polymerase involved in DNA repair